MSGSRWVTIPLWLSRWLRPFLYSSVNSCHLLISSTSVAAAAAAKSLQLCPTLCDPIDGSPLGSPVPGILQARPLEWVAISFFNAWTWKVKVKLLSCVQLFMIPWSAAYQASPPMGFPGKSTGVGSASVRSLLFLSFIMPIFARYIVLISPIIFNRFLVFPHSIVFLYFF